MSSVLFNKLQREFAGAEAMAHAAICQTPAQARREWNGIVITRTDHVQVRPVAATVLYALELGGKLLCMRRSGLRYSINAGTWGNAIAFTSLEALIVFCTDHSRNKIVDAATMVPLTPAEFIARNEQTIHLIVDGEGIDLRPGNALAYAALTPEQRKSGYGYDVRHGNRRAA